MPRYDYYCDANDETVEALHPIPVRFETWGELCTHLKRDVGATDPGAPVRRIILQAPMTSTPVSNSRLKDLGFTKLVKRDDGVYENVTRSGNEKRYMSADDPASLPDLKRKLGD